MKTNNIFSSLIALLFLVMPLIGWSQSEWMVSDSKQKDKNPIAYSDASVKAGKTQFMTNCKSCHGDPTKNNGLPLVPKPTDIALQTFLDKNTDGSIYHKITDGQTTMPSYSAILNDQQRWDIVNFIRSFDKNHSIEKPAKTIAQKPKKKVVEIIIEAPYYLTLNVDVANNKASVLLEGTSKGKKLPIKDAEIFIGIERYYNPLAIMDAGATTNDKGLLEVSYPINLPSGPEGKTQITAYVIDKERFGAISAKAEVILQASHHDKLTETRALWADRSHFPWWLMITYLSIIIIVWGVMFKVILNMFQIKKLGQ